MRSLLLYALATAIVVALIPRPADARGKEASKLPPGKPGGEGTRASSTHTLIDRKLMGLPELVASAKMVPFLAPKQKKLGGYLMSNVVPTTAFHVLGVRDGDVLREVNGTVLDSADKGVVALKRLSEQDSGELTIARKGRTIVVKYRKR